MTVFMSSIYLFIFISSEKRSPYLLYTQEQSHLTVEFENLGSPCAKEQYVIGRNECLVC